jgi:arsenite methyltransferase
MNRSNIKEIVKEKYSRIAEKAAAASVKSSCCAPSSCCGDQDYTLFSENYQELKGYDADADLGLGCGIPTEFAGLKPADHVLDLGSGAGNDCFVARAEVGEDGKVTGLDFVEAMLEKARQNTLKLGYSNVDFIKGDIEQMPLPDNSYDVILSNCVLNLVPDKQRAFSEMLRVLKPGGHFCVSDVVLKGELSEKLRHDAEMYAGCVSGAMQMQEYLDVIAETGFKNIRLHKQRKLEIPEEIVRLYLNDEEKVDFMNGSAGLFSITVSGYKQ